MSNSDAMKAAWHILLFALASTAALTDSEIVARLESLEKENAVMRRENLQIKAELSQALKGLNGELRIFHADECPEGWIEFNRTQGFMLTGRPKNGTSGMTFNRPFDAGEEGRSPSHAHEATVSDPGHTHLNAVIDPGHAHLHSHKFQMGNAGGGNCPDPKENICSESLVYSTETDATVNKTGISVDSLPSQSSISVSIRTNEAGEHFPLVYVLVCQKST